LGINYELYKVFFHVAHCLSFSQAANQLYLSQSAISQSIRLLEEKLNCQLFVRTTKQVKLTREGEVLFAHIEQAYNFIQSGERSLKEMHSLQKGELNLGASDTICEYFLLSYLQKFKKLYPAIKIKITNRTSPKCIELLEKGFLDLAVINLLEEKKYDHLSVQKLQKIHDVFVAGSSFAQLKEQKISWEQLLSYPLLLLEKNSTTRKFLDAFLEQKGFLLKPEIELGSVNLLIKLTVAGLGIAFLSWEHIEEYLSQNKLFLLSLPEQIPSRSIALVTNNKLSLPLAAQKFVNLLKEGIVEKP